MWFLGFCSFFNIIATILIISIIFKIALKLTTGKCISATSLVGKTAIVTGANTGIGYETAVDLAKRGARVILACRNKTKAKEALEKIVEETGVNNAVIKIVDFASLKSVRKFADEINKTENRLDILVNNAGAGGLGEGITEDGLQLGMQVNYFAPFLLTNLLLGLLKQSAPSRIVNVSSITAKMVRNLDIDALNDFPGNSKLYAVSKMCVIMFTIELASKLRSTGVTVNSLHPGVAETEFLRRMAKPIKPIANYFLKLFFKSAREGAQTSIYLAVDKNVELITGEHFHDCKRVERYEGAKDAWLVKKLWKKTEELVKLTAAEMQY